MPAITDVTMGAPVRYNTSSNHCVIGDTWACAWGDDDVVYTVIDDTAGFEFCLRSSGDRNMAFGSFGATAPPRLTGAIANGMEAYGRSNQLGADGACWKGNGLTCLDGVLYLSVSRHWYHVKEYDSRQIARDASIVMSKDKGSTWSPHPFRAEPLPQPLFAGPRFGAPFFLDCGQDGRAPEPAPHGLETYVYAVSTDGYWDNGNALHLARVRREDLPALQLKDWEFFCGLREGFEEPIWRAGKPGLEACYPILTRPFSFGQTGMNYLPALQRYLLIGWHYPRLGRDSWNTELSVWDFYESPTPWGPWTRFASKTWQPEGFYNPGICSKFISRDNRELWILTAGDFGTWNKPPEQTLYTLFMIPVELVV